MVCPQSFYFHEVLVNRGYGLRAYCKNALREFSVGANGKIYLRTQAMGW